jgi:hypothetical protein
MPTSLHLFVAAHAVIERIRVGFPACPIICHIVPALHRLAPVGVRVVTSIGREFESIYRRCDLRYKASETHFSPLALKSGGWPELLLIAAGLWTPADKGLTRTEAKMNGVTDTGPPVIVSFGNTIKSSEGLSRGLRTKLDEEGIDYHHLFTLDEKNPEWEPVLNCSQLVSCGDSPYAYLTAALGKPTFIVFQSAMEKNWQEQFASLDHVKFSHTESITSIQAAIDGLFKRIAVSKPAPASTDGGLTYEHSTRLSRKQQARARLARDSEDQPSGSGDSSDESGRVGATEPPN